MFENPFTLNSFQTYLTPLKNSLFYFTAVGINRGMPFLLIPLLTNIMTVEEYGYISLASVAISLLKNFIGLNPSLFVIAKYFKYSRNELSQYISGILCLVAVTLFIGGGLVFILNEAIGFAPGLSPIIIAAITFPSAFMVVEALALTILQMERRAEKFFLYSFISALLQLLFVIVLVVNLRTGWQGKITGDFLASLLICLLLLGNLIKKGYVARIFDKNKLKDFFTFSFPLLPHSLSLWTMNFMDRFLITFFCGVQAIGLYSAAYNVGMGLMLLYDALQRVWQPYFFEYLEKESYSAKLSIVRWTWLYYLFCIFVFVLSVFVVAWITPWIFGEAFRSAYVYIPLIFLGYTFHGMYRAVAGYLYHLKMNALLAKITFTSALINTVLNIILINANCPIGAAQSTAITFFFSFVVVQLIVIKKYDMPWFSFGDLFKRPLKNIG